MKGFWPITEKLLGAQILFALVGLMGLYAALRPEQYARYFLAQWQRERIAGNLKGLSLIGLGHFHLLCCCLRRNRSTGNDPTLWGCASGGIVLGMCARMALVGNYVIAQARFIY